MSENPVTFPESPWMRPAEAAAYAHVSEKRIRHWINTGQLVASFLTQRKRKRGREEVLIERADLDTLLRSLKRRLTDAPQDETQESSARPRGRRTPAVPSTGRQPFHARIKAVLATSE